MLAENSKLDWLTIYYYAKEKAKTDYSTGRLLQCMLFFLVARSFFLW